MSWQAGAGSPAVTSPLRSQITFCALSFTLPPPVAKKHDFFDSGLLYQFCINFRRRRRLSELLNEGEQNDGEGVAVSTHEDSHPDSPFVLRKSKPQQGNSAFHSGNNKKKQLSILIFCVNVIVHKHLAATSITEEPDKDKKQVTGGGRGSLNSLQPHSAEFPPLLQLSSTSAVRFNPKSGQYERDVNVTEVSEHL